MVYLFIYYYSSMSICVKKIIICLSKRFTCNCLDAHLETDVGWHTSVFNLSFYIGQHPVEATKN